MRQFNKGNKKSTSYTRKKRIGPLSNFCQPRLPPPPRPLYRSHESVHSVACAVLAPRPLILPLEGPVELLFPAGVPVGRARGRLIPRPEKISLEALDTSAGGRPGRASSTGAVGVVVQRKGRATREQAVMRDGRGIGIRSSPSGASSSRHCFVLYMHL